MKGHNSTCFEMNASAKAYPSSKEPFFRIINVPIIIFSILRRCAVQS